MYSKAESTIKEIYKNYSVLKFSQLKMIRQINAKYSDNKISEDGVCFCLCVLLSRFILKHHSPNINFNQFVDLLQYPNAVQFLKKWDLQQDTFHIFMEEFSKNMKLPFKNYIEGIKGEPAYERMRMYSSNESLNYKGSFQNLDIKKFVTYPLDERHSNRHVNKNLYSNNTFSYQNLFYSKSIEQNIFTDMLLVSLGYKVEDINWKLNRIGIAFAHVYIDEFITNLMDVLEKKKRENNPNYILFGLSGHAISVYYYKCGFQEIYYIFDPNEGIVRAVGKDQFVYFISVLISYYELTEEGNNDKERKWISFYDFESIN